MHGHLRPASAELYSPTIYNTPSPSHLKSVVSLNQTRQPAVPIQHSPYRSSPDWDLTAHGYHQNRSLVAHQRLKDQNLSAMEVPGRPWVLLQHPVGALSVPGQSGPPCLVVSSMRRLVSSNHLSPIRPAKAASGPISIWKYGASPS